MPRPQTCTTSGDVWYSCDAVSSVQGRSQTNARAPSACTRACICLPALQPTHTGMRLLSSWSILCSRPQDINSRAEFGTDLIRLGRARPDPAARTGARTQCREGRPRAWRRSRPRRRAPRARTRCSAPRAGRRARPGTRPRRRSGRWWRPWCRCRTCTARGGGHGKVV